MATPPQAGHPPACAAGPAAGLAAGLAAGPARCTAGSTAGSSPASGGSSAWPPSSAPPSSLRGYKIKTVTSASQVHEDLFKTPGPGQRTAAAHIWKRFSEAPPPDGGQRSLQEVQL